MSDGPAQESPARGEPERGSDATTAIGLVVVLLALAGICALVGEHLLLGALRLAAGVLAGAGIGVLLLALLGARWRGRTRALLAGGLALLMSLGLTLPAVLASHVAPLAQDALLSIEALEEGDVVRSVPGQDGPVLVRRADGTAQLLSAGASGPAEVTTIEARPEDLVALTAEGSHLVHTTGTDDAVAATTTVRTLTGNEGSGADAAPTEEATFTGLPLALAGTTLLLHRCEEENASLCTLSGYDLTDPSSPRWTLADVPEPRGPDPVDREIDARAEQPSGLLDAARATGVLPAVPVFFDPAQGWLQLDPETGFPVGRVLAGAEEDCRLAATAPSPNAQSAQATLQVAPVVLTVCSQQDGAMIAAAHLRGELFWASEPSPAGSWQVRLDQGRVLALGTEEGAGTAGEIIASEQDVAWTAPGGGALEEAVPATARLGIDGGRMVLANTSGQLVAYDSASGANTWTLPVSSAGAPISGGLEASTAVVLDPVARTSALDPRGAQRLRIIDAATGAVTYEATTTQEVSAVHALGQGRALVTVGERSLLLGS